MIYCLTDKNTAETLQNEGYSPEDGYVNAYLFRTFDSMKDFFYNQFRSSLEDVRDYKVLQVFANVEIVESSSIVDYPHFVPVEDIPGGYFQSTFGYPLG